MSQQSEAVRGQQRDEGLAAQATSSLTARDKILATPGFYQRAWAKFRHNKVSMVALVVCVVIIGFSLGANLVSKYITGVGYARGSLGEQFLPPFSPDHFLGTDANGRDVLTRLAYGGRVSLLIASLATLTIVFVGGGVGSVAGYFGGMVDSILMRLVDVLLSIPGLPLLILFSSLYRPGPAGLAVILAAVGWTGVARLVRGEVLTLRTREFIEASRVLGASNGRIIFRHILPNVIPVIVVWVSLAIPGFILTEAALSFLGLGVKIPTPSWGNMLQNARDYYTRSWSNVFIPGFLIYLTVLSISLVGKGLRDALDPRLNQ